MRIHSRILTLSIRLLPPLLVLRTAAAVEITGVDPSLVSTLGGTTVTVSGRDFTGRESVLVGGRALVGLSFDDRDGTYRGATQTLTAGFHDVSVMSALGGPPLATLERAVEAAPPPGLTAVDPRQVCADGGTVVTVRGANLRAETRLRFGVNDLFNVLVNLDGTAASGEAPALSATEPTGPTDVIADDSRGRAVLPGGVAYTRSCNVFPGPQEVESSLAEGTARFHWHNPIPYGEILVLNEDGGVIQRLPGDATFLELPAGGADEVRVSLRGTIGPAAFSEDALAMAVPLNCNRPPPLVWGGAPGKLNFTVRGNRLPPAVTRCTAPEGDGAGIPPPSPPAGANAGGGGALALDHGYNGFFQDPGTTGYLAKEIDVLEFNKPFLAIEEGNKLVTGFELPADSDRLEIAAYYEKLATDFGLELRCRLIHVFPDDGFQDEFTFPNVPINQGKDLNSITYFRADKNIGIPGNPNDPNPANQPPKSCQLPIPAGEYILEFYAVGGSAKLPYYNFADDPRDNEILIAGVPCYPYPLVKITDLTGVATLPDILDIKATLPYRGLQTVCEPPGMIRVKFTAYGLWLDEANNEHSIHPGDPTYVPNPRFEYKWKVHDRPNPTVKVTSGNTLSHCVTDWGCYKVEIEAIDKACGFSKKRTIEVPILPKDITCSGQELTFLFPTPDPGGIYAITGLNPPASPPPPSQGSFDGKRPVSFRVLVVPQCLCQGTTPCPAPQIEDLDFRLAVFQGLSYAKIDNVNFVLEDLCPDTTVGAKYFAVTVEDLGQIPVSPALAQLSFRNVYFQGRKKQADPDAGWTNVGLGDAKPLKLTNRPKSIENGFWDGHFIEEDQSYHFVTKSSNKTEEELPLEDSNPIDLGLPGVDVGIPSYANELSSGFTSRFMMMNGDWSPEVGSGTASGQVLSNGMDGAPVQVTPNVVGGGGGGQGGGIFDPPSYEWCDHRTIFEQHFHQTLFESILYSGFIGPIPVTIWASIGFGLDILVESYTSIFVSPFGPLDGGGFAETHFYLLSTVGVAIPCEIRADVVGGLVSIAVRLIPSAEFFLDTHIWSQDTTPHADLFTKALLDLTMEVEGCIDLLLTEACVAVEIPILDDVPIIDPSGTNPRPPVTCEGGGAGAPVLPELASKGADGAGGGIQFALPYQSISAPVVSYTPDKMTSMEVYFEEDGKSSITIDGFGVNLPPGAAGVGKVLDPAVAFVSNTAALVAWTDQYCGESGLGDLCFPNSDPPPPAPTLAQRNLMLAQQEIVVMSIRFEVQPPFVDPLWYAHPQFRIADPPAEVPAAGDRRPDGQAAIAADLSTLSDSPPGGEAIVAWVSYLGDYLIEDGTRTIFERLAQPVICASTNPQQPTKLCRFKNTVVPNIRPQMEVSGIFVRRVAVGGLLPGENKVLISDPGINIEPAVALSPNGETGYCLWVYDPVHEDLITENTGRFLKYSKYSKSTNAWAAPLDVIPNPDDYPGILEPHMALKDELNGLAVYTALKKGAPVRDTGLGGNRFVYGVRLENGAFGEPFLIHGRCNRRVYGWTPIVSFPIPVAFDPLSKLKIPQPDWVINFLGTGPMGLMEGAGDVMVTALGQGMAEPVAPISLTNDENVHSNVAAGLGAGVLKTLNLNGGPALLQPGAGGGAGRGPRSFEVLETRLEPDLAIAACKLSDAFPAPGARIDVEIEVENRGLAGSPLDDEDVTAIGFQLRYLLDDGRERIVGRAPVPFLVPGQKETLRFEIEMPHDPVRLRAVLEPNPVDMDRSNDSRECFFGAPKPDEFYCEAVVINDAESRSAVRMTWTNPAVYDEIFIYRDGAMLTSLPGGSTRFVDLYPMGREVAYEIRGRMGPSKSMRVACTAPPPPGGRLLQGDCNQDGARNISDAICLLGYLFLGQPTRLPCGDGTRLDPGNRDLLNLNGDADVNLSDAVYLLSFLFSGGPPPRLGTGCILIEGCPTTEECAP